MFTDRDIQQIESIGLTVTAVERQIEVFKSGDSFTHLYSAATIGSGIIALDERIIEESTSIFETKKEHLSIIKFVPASGAATRMFKFLFQFLDNYNPDLQPLNTYINENNLKEISLFLNSLEKFPFYEQVKQQLIASGVDYSRMNSNEKALAFIKAMLKEHQLNYGGFPKGLFPFHKYNNKVSTAFEEHLFEMAYYGAKHTPLKLHFTISEQHKQKFVKEFKRIEEHIEDETGFSYNISFSYQQKSTDTVALSLDNKPFRTDDGNLFFRPSGHGALLKNLNAIDADLIFISNIDNVVVKNYQHELAKYRKVLAGILLKTQATVFEYVHKLKEKALSESTLNNIAEFLTQKLNVSVSEEFENFDHNYKVDYLLKALERPIRVCGMVKNEGEPGGGPFWVKSKGGKIALQIVEAAQVNLKDDTQKKILANATHFNPVDIVCSIKDYEGNNFDLEEYVDADATIIAKKTKGIHTIKALERPGLWNGSMAHWNSIFVEVPVLTFNPVKTVNDLLKPPHQIH